MNKDDTRKYRKLYRDVLRGYSEFNYRDDVIYIKHFAESELGDIEAYDEQLYEKAKAEGVLTEKEKIDLLVRDGLWSQEKEDFIASKKEEILNLRQTVKKLLIKRQIEFQSKQIEKKEQELNEIVFERNELIGFTVESYVEKKCSTEYLRHSLYKNADLKEKYWTEEEFYDASEAELAEIAVSNNYMMLNLNPADLRALAACTFFINALAVSKKNPQIFYGKAVKDLSNYQLDLFSNGLRYLSVLEEGKNPTEEALQNPKILVDWYEAMLESRNNKSLRKHDLQKDTVGGTVMGADKQEIQNLVASQAQDGEEVVDLHEEMKRRGKEGGVLSFGDMLEIHGHGKKGENIKID